ncbi:MAG: tRNA pseudouridine(38-40) synthase TruA [Chlorobi bacterium]|nr:tRNA pseudouridine(38-40) synthase TruA [Chlorobiota bacterium]
MSRRYFIQLNYKGTNYHGWQVQPNAVTVQEALEMALSTILRETIKVVGAGRTDTGVHAGFFIAHFDSVNTGLANDSIVNKLNSFLPNDIAIQNIREVANDAHARFDAVSRTYHYYISRVKDPFSIETAYKYTSPLDVDAMNNAAKILFEYGDFTSFSRLHTDVKTNNCKISIAEWKEEGGQLVFTIKADRFLRNMVRAIVGTLLEVGKGKLSIDDMRRIIEQKDRCAAGASAPAKGLFLAAIEYPY